VTRKTYSVAKIRKAVALVRDKGYSYAAAGKEIGGASRDTVKRWCDAEGVRSGAADARTDVPRTFTEAKLDLSVDPVLTGVVGVPAPADDSLESVLRDMQEQLRWTKDQAKTAAADGNQAAASKLNRDAASLANTIARIKADTAKAAGADGLVFSAERLKAARAQLVEMVDRLAASPEGSMGVCPRCGADIRMARASAPDADKEV
jgi:transposase-like protein